MEPRYRIGGGGMHIKKYRVDNDALISAGAGVVAGEATGLSQGVQPTTTTAATPYMGLSIEGAAASTAAQVGAGGGALSNGDNATFTSVIINPDLVVAAKLNEGGTEDTALVISVQDAAQAAGLDISSTPAIADNATVWGYNGANNGHNRTSSAADTVVLAFPNPIAAGDEWLFTEHVAGWTQANPTLTALFTQIDSNTAGTTNANFVFVEFELRDISEDGRNNSFGLMVAHDHAFAGSQLT